MESDLCPETEETALVKLLWIVLFIIIVLSFFASVAILTSDWIRSVQ